MKRTLLGMLFVCAVVGFTIFDLACSEEGSPHPTNRAEPYLDKPRAKWTALDEAKHYGRTHYVGTWNGVTTYCINIGSKAWVPCSVDASHRPEQLLCKGGVGCKPNPAGRRKQ